MSSKYIIARIEIPIEITTDGSHVKHSDRTQINFFHCDILPAKQDHENLVFSEILENLLETSSENKFSEYDSDDLPIIVKTQEPDISDIFEIEELEENIYDNSSVSSVSIAYPGHSNPRLPGLSTTCGALIEACPSWSTNLPPIRQNDQDIHMFEGDSDVNLYPTNIPPLRSECSSTSLRKSLDKPLTEDELAEYFVLKSEIISNVKNPSKNTSFKKRITYRKHNVSSRIFPSLTTKVSDPEY
jgi:hypothetical protein